MEYREILEKTDPAVCQVMNDELARQRDHIELIASENFVSPAVMAAVGSHLTNKYAEGYPGHRYYGGCEYVDVIEDIARARSSFSVRSTPTFSRIPVRRRILRCILRCLNRVIR